VFRVVLLAIVVSCAVGGFLFPQAPPTILAAWQQPQDPKPAPPEKQPPQASQPPTATPAKPADKPKKVITNDDLKTSAGGGSFAFSTGDFSQINNCDRNCFEQVRQLARVYPGANPNWKRDLLQAIDLVRKDSEWQKYLHDLYDMRLRFCQLGDEKRDELAKYADPNNVTPREIAIDDKYDAKFKEAQAALQTLTGNQAALQRKFGANPLAFQFTNVQISRIQNANCAPHGYYNEAPSEVEDP